MTRIDAGQYATRRGNIGARQIAQSQVKTRRQGTRARGMAFQERMAKYLESNRWRVEVAKPIYSRFTDESGAEQVRNRGEDFFECFDLFAVRHDRKNLLVQVTSSLSGASARKAKITLKKWNLAVNAVQVWALMPDTRVRVARLTKKGWQSRDVVIKGKRAEPFIFDDTKGARV